MPFFRLPPVSDPPSDPRQVRRRIDALERRLARKRRRYERRQAKVQAELAKLHAGPGPSVAHHARLATVAGQAGNELEVFMLEMTEIDREIDRLRAALTTLESATRH